MRYSTDIVIIDLEATCPESDEGGNNTVERSNIIEIGAVRVDRRSLEVVDTFSELVRPHEYPVTPFITKLTGITPEMVADAAPFVEVAPRFFEWYGDRNKAIIGAFGAYYDIPLLRRECDANGLDFRSHIAGGAFDLRAVATVWLAEHHHRTSGQRLESILEKMGVDLAKLSMHRAVDDARAAAMILQKHHLGYVLP